LDDCLGEKMLQQNIPEGKKIRTGLGLISSRWQGINSLKSVSKG
jgi:hypothetical protein